MYNDIQSFVYRSLIFFLDREPHRCDVSGLLCLRSVLPVYRVAGYRSASWHRSAPMYSLASKPRFVMAGTVLGAGDGTFVGGWCLTDENGYS